MACNPVSPRLHGPLCAAMTRCGLLLAQAFLVVAAHDGLFGDDAPLSNDKRVLLDVVDKYRESLSKGLKAQYRITCNALDEDGCTATWLHESVVKGRYSRVSWLLESSSKNIAAHGRESETTAAFTACAISVSPQRIEWLSRGDGEMISYSFAKNELAELTEQALPRKFYPFLNKYVTLRNRHQLSALTLPFAIFNGFAMGGTLPIGGWMQLHDEEFLRSSIAKITVEKSTDTSLTFKRIMDDAEFSQFFHLSDAFVKSHTPAEAAARVQEARTSFGGYFHRLVLGKREAGWVVERAETGTGDRLYSSSSFAFGKGGLLQSCTTTSPPKDGAIMHYELIHADDHVAMADLSVDPSEARTITDAATGMTIEPR